MLRIRVWVRAKIVNSNDIAEYEKECYIDENQSITSVIKHIINAEEKRSRIEKVISIRFIAGDFDERI